MRISADRLPIVGVMGSSRREHNELAGELGLLLASLGVHLLTGGGAGVMAAVSRAFRSAEDRRGMIIGILPCRPDEAYCRPPEEYPNEWVEIAIRTHLPRRGASGPDARTRNHINILTSDAIVVLPGGEGTLAEIRLAQRYRRPMIGYFGADVPALAGLAASIEIGWDIDSVERFLRSELGLDQNGG